MAYFFLKFIYYFFLFLTFCWPLDTIAPPTVTPYVFCIGSKSSQAYQEIKHTIDA